MRELQHWIDGAAIGSVSGDWLDSVEPATGTTWARFPDGDEADVALAAQAAERTLPAWSSLPTAERSRFLTAIADGIAARLEEFAEAESRDTGKPIALARAVDIPRAIENFRFFAGAILHESSEFFRAGSSDPATNAWHTTLRRPVGVAGCISPWNLPLYLFSWKIAPALAAGCTVVGKPSELAPVTAYMLGEVAREVGLPDGVLNIVHGLGPRTGAAIVAHPRIPAISFTGGTVTGETIARTAAPMFKKLSLELGGKNPSIVFRDADLNAAISGTVSAAFTNQGQICLCGSRLLVEAKVYEQFVPRFLDRVRALRVGDPMKDETACGALISEDHLEKVSACVRQAREDGGRIEIGGEAVRVRGRCARGSFYAPTVITGAPPSAAVNQDEIFGPVVSIIPFKDEAEAIKIANDVPYGLAATVWTENLSRAHRVAEQLEAGIQWFNCWMLRDLRVPFGGLKQSGVGREGGWDALRFFTEAKSICVRFDPQSSESAS